MVAGMIPPLPDVTGDELRDAADASGRYEGRWRCVRPFGEHHGRPAGLLGDGAGSQAEGGRVPCPVPPDREKLPGSS